jgi:hypothetical protein
MEQVFVVTLHTVNWGVDDFDVGAVLLKDAVAYALDGGLASVRVTHDAALADVFAAGFELRLYEDDGFALPLSLRRAESAEDCRKDKGGGDEGDVHAQKGGSRYVCDEEFARGEEAGVGALAQDDAGIVAEFLGDLAVAGVDGKDGRGAMLQHAVGEAAGGGADVDAGNAGERDGPVGEGVLEFEAAAADVLEIGAEEADGCVGGDRGAGLVDTLFVNEDATGEDEGLGTFARGGVTAIDEELIEAYFFKAIFFLAIVFRGHHFPVHAVVPKPTGTDKYLFMVYERGALC